MVQWRLYITNDGHKRYMLPKDSTKDMKIIEHTCVLSGETFKSRKLFWKYIEDSKLDPDTMAYDRKTTCENTELMDKSDLEWLWTHYFKEKGTKKNLQNLLGSINLELYIILLKVYKGEMDIDECLNDINSNVKESTSFFKFIFSLFIKSITNIFSCKLELDGACSLIISPNCKFILFISSLLVIIIILIL